MNDEDYRMQNKMIKWNILGAVVLSLTACADPSSQFGEGTSNSASFTSGTTTPSTTTNTNNSGNSQTVNINIYNGSWGTSPQCVYNNQSAQGISSFWNFSGGNGILNSNTYGTSDCSGSHDSLQLGYQFQYGNTLPSTSSVCANVVEVTMVLVSATQNGQSIPFSQLDSTVRVRQYDLVCATGDRLYFGDTRSNPFYDGSSTHRRPTDLDQDYPFLRF